MCYLIDIDIDIYPKHLKDLIVAPGLNCGSITGIKIVPGLFIGLFFLHSEG